MLREYIVTLAIRETGQDIKMICKPLVYSNASCIYFDGVDNYMETNKVMKDILIEEEKCSEEASVTIIGIIPINKAI